MTWILASQIGYLLLTVPMTLLVATTLSHHVRAMLTETLASEVVAGSVARLSVVGFLLVGLGTVLVGFPSKGYVPDAAAFLRLLASKVGVAALLTGLVYLALVWILRATRPRAHTPLPGAGPWGWPPAYPHPAYAQPYRAPQAFPPAPAAGPPAPGAAR